MSSWEVSGGGRGQGIGGQGSGAQGNGGEMGTTAPGKKHLAFCCGV